MDVDLEVQAAIQATLVARAKVVEVTGGKRGVSGETKCPICTSGTLRYSVAKNKHIHGQCSTDGCVRWME